MDIRDRLAKDLGDFAKRSALNYLAEFGGINIFDEPLVKVAAADDPLWARLKDPGVIREGHLSPAEWLPGARSVVSYFLPFSRKIREANRIEGLPALEWVYGRIEGEEFNNALRDFLVAWLERNGGRAVAPPRTDRYEVVERRSNWSERHAAFIAGLGTFGLSKSMITERGSAGRFGSAVTDLYIEPTPRDYEGVYERCPWVERRECGVCLDRCPSGAITPEGKKVEVCSDYLDNEVKPRFAPRYGCGKCQTNVPCEEGVPA